MHKYKQKQQQIAAAGRQTRMVNRAAVVDAAHDIDLDRTFVSLPRIHSLTATNTTASHHPVRAKSQHAMNNKRVAGGRSRAQEGVSVTLPPSSPLALSSPGFSARFTAPKQQPILDPTHVNGEDESIMVPSATSSSAPWLELVSRACIPASIAPYSALRSSAFRTQHNNTAQTTDKTHTTSKSEQDRMEKEAESLHRDIVMMAASEGIVYHRAFGVLDADGDGFLSVGDSTRWVRETDDSMHDGAVWLQGEGGGRSRRGDGGGSRAQWLEAAQALDLVVAAATAEERHNRQKQQTQHKHDDSGDSISRAGIDFSGFVKAMRTDTSNALKSFALAVAEGKKYSGSPFGIRTRAPHSPIRTSTATSPMGVGQPAWEQRAAVNVLWDASTVSADAGAAPATENTAGSTKDVIPDASETTINRERGGDAHPAQREVSSDLYGALETTLKATRKEQLVPPSRQRPQSRAYLEDTDAHDENNSGLVFAKMAAHAYHNSKTAVEGRVERGELFSDRALRVPTSDGSPRGGSSPTPSALHKRAETIFGHQPQASSGGSRIKSTVQMAAHAAVGKLLQDAFVHVDALIQKSIDSDDTTKDGGRAAPVASTEPQLGLWRQVHCAEQTVVHCIRVADLSATAYVLPAGLAGNEDTTPCSECSYVEASRVCLPCGDEPLCTACFKRLHAKGKRFDHIFAALKHDEFTRPS